MEISSAEIVIIRVLMMVNLRSHLTRPYALPSVNDNIVTFKLPKYIEINLGNIVVFWALIWSNRIVSGPLFADVG